MASPRIKNGRNREKTHYISLNHPVSTPLFPRRFAAWVVEVSLLAASAFVPYTLGVYADSHSPGDKVPLNPVLANTEEAIASTLALPKRVVGEQQVAPLTNLFWWIALATPIVLTGSQLYLQGKTGQTHPKKWFNLRVVISSGQSPGLSKVFVREGLGRWGIPVGTAYLIWRYSGAFPNLGILAGLSLLMLASETGMVLFGHRKRTFHDSIAGTIVTDANQPLIYSPSNYATQPLTYITEISVPSQSNGNGNGKFHPTTVESSGSDKLTTIVLTTQVERGVHLWNWMREHPGITLLIVASAGMISVLATFVGTQIYIQTQANNRDFKQQNNQVFLALVKQLSSTSSNPIEERRAAILALARLDDERAVPMLVDLLGQEKEPSLIEAIQQALASRGIEALAPLRRLNQSLSNDIKSLAQYEANQEASLIALRLRATKRAIAKLLTIYSGTLNNTDLYRLNLGQISRGSTQFTLVLDQIDLSGINFRGAILNNASLKNTRFANAGEDKRLGTFDDYRADLGGADLKQADLSGAFLSNINLNRINLLRATLNRANFTQAKLLESNLSSAQAIEANFREAILQNSSLTGADLGEADFSRANLQGASLGMAIALGADFSFANLSQANFQGANLTSANFSNSNLQQADLSYSQLTAANLRNAQLQNANLENADLSSADLRGANLAGANFQGVSLARQKSADSNQFLQAAPMLTSLAKIDGVNFSNVKNLDQNQIELICNNGGYHTQCP